MPRDAHLSGCTLRLVLALLRAPVVGRLLARLLAARILAPVLAAAKACEGLPPLVAPPSPRSAEDG